MEEIRVSKVIGWALALIIVVIFGGWLLGWFSVPFSVTSPSAVREQWRFAYQYEESLAASALDICGAEKVLTSAGADEERVQRQSQLIALEQNYARIAAEYNARLRDAFAAKYVRPSDVPDAAPTLASAKAKACS